MHAVRRLGRLRVIDNAMARLSIADRLRRLPPGIDAMELAYATVRDSFEAALSRHKQLLAEIDACQEPVRHEELQHRITHSTGRIVHLRRLAQNIGAMSFSLAFFEIAHAMLPPSLSGAIRRETEAVMGRPIHEIRRKQGESNDRLDNVEAIVGQFRDLLVEAGLIEAPAHDLV